MSWWRRQRTALIALAAALVAAAGAYVWLDLLPNLPPDGPRVTAAETSAEIAGQTLSMGDATWDEFDAPDGTRSLSIRLSSGGGIDAEPCGPATLTETDSGRVWVSSRAGLDVPYDEGERSCIADDGPYRILLVFLLPDDATDPFDLDIAGADDDLVRFVVEP